MNFTEQFASVDLIINTNFETRGVDAFALSLIKAEKQIRRIFTFLIFQNPTYSLSDLRQLRTTLANNRRVYFQGFIAGINLILPRDLQTIYGADYIIDLNKFLLYTQDRNKIFHGQITDAGLSRADLMARVDDIKKWCKHLGTEVQKEIGYDGFSQSYIKTATPLALNNLNRFDTIVNYEQFLRTEVQR
ncbi:MAG: hypothetical protein IPP31_11280 [Chitinophagaceae bacterium]|nr:hypothetical protein [Chitinophagaceae bacterium]